MTDTPTARPFRPGGNTIDTLAGSRFGARPALLGDASVRVALFDRAPAPAAAAACC